ncbi:MAG: hypothetical protein WC506_01355 [Candidatus Micrarchaeia archaeon]
MDSQSLEEKSLESAYAANSIDLFTYRKAARELATKEYARLNGKDKTPKYSVVDAGRCDRGCQRCFAACGPKDSMLDFEYAERILAGNAAQHIAFTISEPFCYHWNSGNGRKTIADLAISVLEKNPNTIIEIVTSGIKFSSALEQAAAGKFASLATSLKNRISFTLSASRFPNFKGADPAQVQRDSLIYFLKSGFEFHVMNWLPKLEFKEQIALPVSMEIAKLSVSIPCHEDLEGLFSGSSVAHQKGSLHTKRQGPIGAFSVIGEERLEGFLPSYDVPNPCVMQNGTIQLNPDKTVSPGCCRFVAPFIAIGDSSESRESLKSKLDIFRKTLMKKSGFHPEKGVCTHCIEIAISKGQVREKARLANLLPGISRQPIKI